MVTSWLASSVFSRFGSSGTTEGIGSSNGLVRERKDRVERDDPDEVSAGGREDAVCVGVGGSGEDSGGCGGGGESSLSSVFFALKHNKEFKLAQGRFENQGTKEHFSQSL